MSFKMCTRYFSSIYTAMQKGNNASLFAVHVQPLILHPNSGELVVSRNIIREVSLEYCKSTLANNVPSEQFYEHIQSKIQKVKVKRSEEDGDSTIQRETFSCVLAKFKKSGKKIMIFWSSLEKSFKKWFSSFA